MENKRTIRPKRIDDVLTNPGMGFTTFQRFNHSDDLDKAIEGLPVHYKWPYQSRTADDHPVSAIAYMRFYWKFLEPERGRYRWDIIDKALDGARKHSQEVMFRVAPYGTGDDDDVPGWYREMVGPERRNNGDKWKYDGPYWMVDANDPRYAECFGGFVRELGKRYDNHPDLDSVDISIVGSWGEGVNGDRLTQAARVALNDAYLESFNTTPLLILLEDRLTNRYPTTKRDVGYRFDCLGDMGEWEHMNRIYPFTIIDNGLENLWQKAPLSCEACWVMEHWRKFGWDIDYIIEQSLKWHMSSFNNKSSFVHEDLRPKVDGWLKKMGYRLALRRLEYEGIVRSGNKLEIASWWENLGVAPCYKNYLLAYRLRNDAGRHIVISDADIRSFLPGDTLHKTQLHLPARVPAGQYAMDVAIVDKRGYVPRVKLAVEGLREDGWYDLNAPVEILSGIM